MTALNAFLFGMPLLLIAGSVVTLIFAKRAAAEIRSHEAPRSAVVTHAGPVSGQAYTPNVAKILQQSQPRAKVS